MQIIRTDASSLHILSTVSCVFTTVTIILQEVTVLDEVQIPVYAIEQYWRENFQLKSNLT